MHILENIFLGLFSFKSFEGKDFHLKLIYLLGYIFFISPNGMVSGQDLEKKRIEDSLLTVANENIEKYRKGTLELMLIDSTGQSIPGVQLTINQVSQDFLFGNLSEEIFRENISEADFQKFTERFTELFNFTELTVKWAPYEPIQGRPQWQKLQQKIDWCKNNNITPKGHTLGWTHEAGTPRWLQKYPIDHANILYEARIKNLVGGFSNEINSWDVVNEPVTTIPWEKALLDTLSVEGKIDEGYRYATQGISLAETVPWVKNSFDWAREANQSGEFIINEFFVIAKPEVREKYFQLIDTLLSMDVPVKGIGIQAHEPRDRWFSPLEIVVTFNRLQELGLPLHITEFTPQSSGIPITGDWKEGVWDEEAQADFSEMFYTLAFGHPAMKSIHWWGLSDRWIWLKGGGLLDKNLDPKPVYHRLKGLIKEKWMTKNLTLQTNKNGLISFKGFYGEYEVLIELPSGEKILRKIHLKEEGDASTILKI